LQFWGYCPGILPNLHGRNEPIQMSELLPLAFDSKFLK